MPEPSGCEANPPTGYQFWKKEFDPELGHDVCIFVKVGEPTDKVKRNCPPAESGGDP